MKGSFSEQGSSQSQQKETTKPKIDAYQNQKVEFKDFEILENIGEGSFGRVFKCRKKNDE